MNDHPSARGGVTIAALALRWIYPAQARDAAKLGAPALNSVISSGAGVFVEAVLTFFLVWVIFATAADTRGTFKSIAGLAIGLTISVDVLCELLYLRPERPAAVGPRDTGLEEPRPGQTAAS